MTCMCAASATCQTRLWSMSKKSRRSRFLNSTRSRTDPSMGTTTDAIGLASPGDWGFRMWCSPPSRLFIARARQTWRAWAMGPYQQLGTLARARTSRLFTPGKQQRHTSPRGVGITQTRSLAPLSTFGALSCSPTHPVAPWRTPRFRVPGTLIEHGLLHMVGSTYKMGASAQTLHPNGGSDT